MKTVRQLRALADEAEKYDWNIAAERVRSGRSVLPVAAELMARCNPAVIRWMCEAIIGSEAARDLRAIRSPKRSEASRENGKKGGRPRKEPAADGENKETKG